MEDKEKNKIIEKGLAKIASNEEENEPQIDLFLKEMQEKKIIKKWEKWVDSRGFTNWRWKL